MESIVQSLEQTIILNDELVLDLKHNIRHNHPSANSSFRARLLAQLLRDRIDQYLTNLTEEQQAQIRVEIIKNSIEAGSINVSQRDIVHQVIEYCSNNIEYSNYLSEWFNIFVDSDLSNDQMMSILKNINPDVSFDYLFNNDLDKSNLEVEETGQTESNNVGSLKNSPKKSNVHYYKIITILLALIVTLPILIFSKSLFSKQTPPAHLTFVHASSLLTFENTLELEQKKIVNNIFYREAPGYPEHLEYIDVDYNNISVYLNKRGSLLIKETYLNTIDSVADEYNVNPLLLLAIIGQEQGFVPQDSPYADRILNNPFNVYNSWTSYNTDLQDSCEIASGTIRNILKERPVGENPFRWLNTRYAEDPNWWKGVQELYNTLVIYSENPNI